MELSHGSPENADLCILLVNPVVQGFASFNCTVKLIIAESNLGIYAVKHYSSELLNGDDAINFSTGLSSWIVFQHLVNSQGIDSQDTKMAKATA